MATKDDLISAIQACADTSGDLDVRVAAGDPALGPIQVRNETEETGGLYAVPGVMDCVFEGIADTIDASGGPGPLTNGSGGAVTLGQITYVSGNNTFDLADSTTTDGLLGFVEDASIGAGATGAVAINGVARMLLVTGITPSAGDKLYRSATAGELTTVASGDTVGTILDTAGFSDPANRLVTGIIRI